MKISLSKILSPILRPIAKGDRVVSPLPVSSQSDKFVMTGEIYSHYNELMDDLKSAPPDIPFYTGEAVAYFVDTVKTLMDENLGVKLNFSSIFAKMENTAFTYFENHNPKAYLILYETLAKYKALAGHANPPLNTEFISQDLPKVIEIKDNLISLSKVPADFLGYGHDRIRIDTSYFQENSTDTAKKHLEHELGHFYNEKHSGSIMDNDKKFRPCSFLHLLTPEEKRDFAGFKQIYIENFDEIRHWASAFFKADKKALDFPETYKQECTQLNSLDTFCQHISMAKNVINQLGKEKGIENLYEKFIKAAGKLRKFRSDFTCAITRDEYYLTHPEESKAEVFAVRAGAEGFDAERELPVSEKLEEQLAKLGMPPPMTYTILPKGYFAKKLAKKS